MTMLNVANRAISTLASDISDTDTSLTVASGDGVKFPPSNFVVTIEDERILVGTRTDDTFSSLTRHYDNSTAVAHTAGTDVDLNVTAAVIDSLKANINTRLAKDGSVAITNDWDVDGANTLFVDKTNGRVGIGTSAPSSNLDIESSGDAVVELTSTRTGGRSWSLRSGSGVSGNEDNFRIYDLTAGADRFVIDDNGNVGIGTAAPSRTLDVAGTIAMQGGGLYAGGIWSSPRQMMYGTGGGTYIKSIDNDAGDGIKFMSFSGSQLMTILDNGNIGIGTTSPNYKTHIVGTLGVNPGSSVAPVNNGDIVVEATNDTTLTFKLKGSDGTVRSGTLTLS